jgi:hypothetical protein
MRWPTIQMFRAELTDRHSTGEQGTTLSPTALTSGAGAIGVSPGQGAFLRPGGNDGVVDVCGVSCWVCSQEKVISRTGRSGTWQPAARADGAMASSHKPTASNRASKRRVLSDRNRITIERTSRRRRQSRTSVY